MKKKGLRKTGLIKKGAPHPGHPTFKFDSAHLKSSEAVKKEHDLLDSPKIDETRVIHVPRQYLVYKHRAPRITPKTPRLRR